MERMGPGEVPTAAYFTRGGGAGVAGRVKVTQILEGPFSASSKSLFAGKVSKLSC